jgi:hypothetical protein
MRIGIGWHGCSSARRANGCDDKRTVLYGQAILRCPEAPELRAVAAQHLGYGSGRPSTAPSSPEATCLGRNWNCFTGRELECLRGSCTSGWYYLPTGRNVRCPGDARRPPASAIRPRPAGGSAFRGSERNVHGQSDRRIANFYADCPGLTRHWGFATISADVRTSA